MNFTHTLCDALVVGNTQFGRTVLDSLQWCGESVVLPASCTAHKQDRSDVCDADDCVDKDNMNQQRNGCCSAVVVQERRGGTHRDGSHLVGVAGVHTLSGFVT